MQKAGVHRANNSYDTKIEVFFGRPVRKRSVFINGIEYLFFHLSDAVTDEHLHLMLLLSIWISHPHRLHDKSHCHNSRLFTQ